MTKEMKFAGFWLRFIAYIIDSAILAVVGSGLTLLLFVTTAPDWLGSFVTIVLAWAYYAGMESSSYQGTVGKLATGIYVSDLKGKQINFGKASGRFFGKYVSAFIFLIGFIMIAFTEKKQGLHDMMARCLVLRKE